MGARLDICKRKTKSDESRSSTESCRRQADEASSPSTHAPDTAAAQAIPPTLILDDSCPLSGKPKHVPHTVPVAEPGPSSLGQEDRVCDLGGGAVFTPYTALLAEPSLSSLRQEDIVSAESLIGDKFGDYDNRVQSEILTEIETNIQWLDGISCHQRERLKNYLLNLDKAHRVDLDCEKTQTVHSGVKQIVEMISTGIQQHDPRFTGTLVPMGSSRNQTKLGNPDEFDYVFQLELRALLEGRGSFERKDGGFIDLKMDGGVADVDMVIYGPGPDNATLDRDKLSSLLEDIILKVLSELELPTGWQHGGIKRPSFSGIRRQGPSFVLQFDYLNTSNQDPLRLSLDFVPMVKIPFAGDDLAYFLKRETGLEYRWVPINDLGKDSYGHSEELFLNKYSPESTPKKLMRISKAVRIILQMHLTAYPSESGIEKILTYKVFHRRHRDFTYINSSIRKEDYVTYSDLGESGTGSYMVVSYEIKQTVLRMMSEDESLGRGWTDDDLPELVIRVYLHILSFPHLTLNRGDLVKQKIFISLEDEKTTTTRKGSPLTQKTTLHPKVTNSTLYKEYNKYVKAVIKDQLGSKEDKQCILSRIASLFLLSRCVCEEKRKVELVIYDQIESTSLVSKEKFKELKKKYLKND